MDAPEAVPWGFARAGRRRRLAMLLSVTARIENRCDSPDSPMRPGLRREHILPIFIPPFQPSLPWHSAMIGEGSSGTVRRLHCSRAGGHRGPRKGTATVISHRRDDAGSSVGVIGMCWMFADRLFSGKGRVGRCQPLRCRTKRGMILVLVVSDHWVAFISFGADKRNSRNSSHYRSLNGGDEPCGLPSILTINRTCRAACGARERRLTSP